MKYESAILEKLENFELEEINQGIIELESKIGKVYFGNSFKEKLSILYALKSQTCRRKMCQEVQTLKKSILQEWLSVTDEQTATAKTFNTWAKYQNQLKGMEFVRDSLKCEFEQLKVMEVKSI